MSESNNNYHVDNASDDAINGNQNGTGDNNTNSTDYVDAYFEDGKVWMNGVAIGFARKDGALIDYEGNVIGNIAGFLPFFSFSFSFFSFSFSLNFKTHKQTNKQTHTHTIHTP